MDERKSVVTSRPRDCLACKLVGGFGCLGIGAYVAKNAFPMKRGYGRTLYLLFALGAAGIGVARLLDEIPAFHTKPK